MTRKMRPILVIQNDVINKFSPTIMIVPLTSNTHKKRLPIHVAISKDSGLPVDSLILLDQIKTIHKTKIIEKLGQVSPEIMMEVENAISLATSQSKIDSEDFLFYKEFYPFEYDLREIKEILKSSNYIGNKIRDWIFSGLIGAIIGIIISKIILL